MDIGQAVFVILFISSTAATLMSGNRVTKASGLLSVIAAVATAAVEQSRFAQPEIGVLIVDISTAAGFLILAHRSRAKWLAWCAVAQIMSVVTHLTRLTLPNMGSLAYYDAVGIWSFPIMLLMLVGSGECELGSVTAKQAITPNQVNQSSSIVYTLVEFKAQIVSAWEKLPLPRSVITFHKRLTSTGLSIISISEKFDGEYQPFHKRQNGEDRSTSPRHLMLSSVQDVAEYLQQKIGNLNREHVRILYFDSRFKFIKDEIHSIGTINEAPIYVRDIAASALSLGSAGIIMAHNHPNGDCTPSRQDIQITKDVHRVLQPLGIRVHDHLIVSNSKWVSFLADGLMNEIRNTTLQV